MPGHDIIVIGASAGGVETLIKLVQNLPKNLPSSIFVVLHIPAEGPDLSFTSESIQSAQIEAFEQALWTAYKTLQESTNFSYRMAKRAQERSNIRLARIYEEKAKDTQQRANIIHNVLLKDPFGVLTVETPSSPKTHSHKDP